MTPEQPLRPARTSAFKKDLERCRKRGYDMDLARVVMGRLIHRETLDPVHADHPLKGEWSGHRECHIRPDWLLIYRIDDDHITFVAITDRDWFDFLARQEEVDEVNFWQPSAGGSTAGWWSCRSSSRATTAPAGSATATS